MNTSQSQAVEQPDPVLPSVAEQDEEAGLGAVSEILAMTSGERHLFGRLCCGHIPLRRAHSLMWALRDALYELRDCEEQFARECAFEKAEALVSVALGQMNDAESSLYPKADPYEIAEDLHAPH